MLIGIGALGAPQTAQEKAALVQYQSSGDGPLPMIPHGHADANTLINQGIYDPLDSWSNSIVSYVAEGKKPGTFLRDMAGVNNQVPQWGWFVMSGVGFLLAGLAYRRHRQEKKTKSKKK